jgi:hypothetical protein
MGLRGYNNPRQFSDVLSGQDCTLRERAKADGMRRPISGRDAIRSQVIEALEAQEIKETGNEEG